MAEKKEKTVYVGITGDIIHPGIINIIQQGAKYGRLIVGLLTNSAIATHKRIPYLTYEQRKAVLENIKGVSEVVPQEDWSYVPNLKKLKPDYIIHGDDWKTNYLKNIREEVFEVMKKIGGEVIEIPYTKGINSSQLFEDQINIGITADQRLKSLRELMRYKPYLRIMEAYSGLSGLIIENLKIEKEDGIHRFDGIFISVSIDATHLGIFEPESSNSTSKLNVISDIIECTTKPIIVGGYTCDLQDNLSLVVEQLELKGISAIIIEDKCKKITLSGDIQELVNEEEFSYKIKEGKKGQTTSDFMIIAGIEELAFGKSVEEALKKANASIKAGADGILLSSNEKNGDNVKAFINILKKNYRNGVLILSFMLII